MSPASPVPTVRENPRCSTPSPGCCSARRAATTTKRLINDSLEACQVALEFDYENNRYRVERGKQKGKGAQLEFQIQSVDGKLETTDRSRTAPDGRTYPQCASSGLRHLYQFILLPAGQSGYVCPADTRQTQGNSEQHSGAGSLGTIQRRNLPPPPRCRKSSKISSSKSWKIFFLS